MFRFVTANQDWRTAVTNLNMKRLNISTFDLRENLKLRSNERRREQQQNGWYSERGDRPKLNCMYLVTAWSPAAMGMEPIPEEHNLLYAVVEGLLRHRSICVADVYGSGITVSSN